MPTATSKKSLFPPILVGLVFFAVVGLVAWWTTQSGESTNRGSAETSEAETGSPSQSPAKRSDDSPAASSASVSGHVRSKSGASLERARVTLLPLAGEGESGEPIDVACDAQGAWSIATLAPGRYALSATARDHLPGWRPELQVQPGADVQGLDLVLEPGGSELTGNVRDLTGGEIEAARIQLTPVGALWRGPKGGERESFFAQTDADGHYAVQVGEGRFRVEASHPDYSHARVVLDLAAGARTHDFQLVPMAVIEGVVVRADRGSPVAEASVTWSREVVEARPNGERATLVQRGGTVTTDDQGRFRIRGLTPGTVLIGARAPELASDMPTAVPIGIAEHVRDLEIRVGPAADLRGRVVAADDRSGIAGAEVDLSSPTGPGGSAIADAEGRFVIHGVQPGGYDLLARADGWLPKLPAMRVAISLDPTSDVEVTLERGLAIRGRVEPATRAGISIEIQPQRMERDAGPMGMGMGMMMISAATATSDPEQGQFELTPVQPGTYTLVAKAADGRGGRVEVEVGPGGVDDVVLKLEPRAKLAGTVRDRSGQPVAGASVIAHKLPTTNTSVRVVVNGRELTASHAPTSEEGRYELLGLDAGAWTLEVVDAGGDPLAWADGSTQTLSVELRAAEVRESFDLSVEARDGTITGTVRDADGHPVADAWVSASFVPGSIQPAHAPEPSEAGPRSEMTMVVENDSGLSAKSTMPPTLTDAEGRFEFTGLRRGPHTLVAESTGEGGGLAKVTREGVIPDDDVVLELAPLGRIEGKVTGDPDEDCIARDCLVRLVGPTSRSGKVHEGRFDLARLDPGHYTLDIETPTGGAHVEVDVEAGETADVELPIQRFARVRGRILDAQDQPVVGVDILIGDSPEEGMVQITQDGSKEPTLTDAEGRFDVAVAPGARVVLAIDMKNPAPLALQRFTVESGKDVDLGDLKPPPAGFGGPIPEG